MTPFVRAAAVRAVRTAAQAALASLGTTAAIQSVDWEIVAGTSALAALLSVLTSLAGLPEVEGE